MKPASESTPLRRTSLHEIRTQLERLAGLGRLLSRRREKEYLINAL
jgi:hypothetical protein